ncbi:MAG: Sua5 YciO YrdC YwlC family protein [Epsilonproteobacteria bacterium]|nr:MAG: Sua5 YciO YrdC YwlC family protein [Campylobacterota bacterium]
MKTPVLLAQTDTTVGFLSQDTLKLSRIKRRSSDKPFLKSYADLKTFKCFNRIPKHFKRQLRRSRTTTYVVKAEAFRIISDPIHQSIITPYGWLYSTSANLSGHGFSNDFAQEHADIIIEDKRGLHETLPSNIIKLGFGRRKRLR